MFPYASLRFYPYEYNPTPPCFSSSAETPGIQFKCPEGWTVARCLKRQQEFSSQMVVNNQIHREMIVAAQQRANRDVYRRKQPQRLQQEHAEYYRRVHQALGLAEGANNVSQYFMPWKNFSHNSFADFSVLGFPKAGTSQLYKLLVSHSQTDSVFKRKEFCMDHNHFLDYTLPQHADDDNALRDLRKKLFQYHKQILKRRTIVAKDQSPRPFLVNACLQPQEVEYHMAYTPMPEASKFFLLFRDPADWLWASWNFWVDKNLDHRPPIDHDWASVGVHYRSPELFHELILSREATKSAAKRFRTMREQTVHVPRRLLHLLGKESLLFLKSEDMKASHGRLPQFLKELSDFTGLAVSQFDSNVAHGQTNCNAQKGYKNLCNATISAESHSSGYEITRHRPMLEETRQLIYIQFYEECKVWAEEFGVIYPDCLRVVPTNE